MVRIELRKVPYLAKAAQRPRFGLADSVARRVNNGPLNSLTNILIYTLRKNI